MKYKVVFEFKWFGADSDGLWHCDSVDNNGKGFTKEEAERIAQEINGREWNRNAKVEVLYGN